MADKDWVPEFEGQRPPLMGGRVVHGARGGERLLEVAAAIERQLAETSPEFAAADDVARRSLALIAARIQLAHVYLDEHGIVDERGHERPVVRELVKWEGRLATLSRELGMTTLARSELRLNQAKVVGEVMSFAEVQAAMSDVFRLASRFVPRERLSEFLGESRALLDGVEERRELGAGDG